MVNLSVLLGISNSQSLELKDKIANYQNDKNVVQLTEINWKMHALKRTKRC